MNANNIQESINKAVDLGLITSEQVQSILMQFSEDKILEILEDMISNQMTPGVQCSGNHCSV